jgi:capsular exopolysaccharide synthesis family protein
MTDTSQEITGLKHYVTVLRHGWWIVAITTALISGLALGLSLAQPKLYESSADVFLGNQSLPSSLSDFQPLSTDPKRLLATQANLARVPAVARRALEIVGVENRTAAELLDASTVTSVADTDILTFTLRDHDRALAQRLATAYAQAYTQYRRQLDTASLVQARRHLDERIAELRKEGANRGTLYSSLVEDAEQLQTVEALQASNASLVRSAAAPTQIQPKPKRNGMLGLVLGLLLGTALAFVRDTLNTRVSSAVEVESRLQMPLLGRLPEPPRRAQGTGGLVMLDTPNAPDAEAYRILATNIGFVNLERGARSIMVTSALRAEGKSTTIANLAVALARAGERVILVDLDLRRPKLDQFFSLEGQPGITSVILGKTQLDDALVPIALTNGEGRSRSSRDNGATTQGSLAVLPAGPLAPNPAEVSGSHKVKTLLDALTKRADIVLIDGPPILHISDAMALTAKVDAALVITRLTEVRRPVLNELRRVLQTAPVTKLGFVVTGTSTDESYGYGYEAYGSGLVPEPEPEVPERELV